MMMPSLLFLSACGPSAVIVGVGTDDPPDDTTVPHSTTTSTTEPPAGGTGTDTVEQVDSTIIEEPWPKSCPDFYDPDQLVTFELEISDTVWSELQSDCWNGVHPYHPVTFGYDGERVEAQVRLKGNWSWSCDKYQFVVSFNEEDSAARFRGVRKIMLDAPWYDHTLLHERLAFPLFEARGLPYSCANSARLMINGEYYGIYANIERIDHEYLERNYENPDGNLYQGGTELKTNEDIGDTSDIEALNAARTAAEIADQLHRTNNSTGGPSPKRSAAVGAQGL